jgi:FkbM family methyltransferase
MMDFLIDSGVPFDGKYLSIPEAAKHVKIDVGLAFNAPQSAVWIDNEPDVFVFGFEPIAKNREVIRLGNSKTQYKVNPKDLGIKLGIIPCALGSEVRADGIEFFVTKADPGCSSFLEPVAFEVEYKEKVPLWRIQDFLTYFPFHRFPSIDHLKIDVQGSDFEVIKGIGTYFPKIIFITVEIDVNGYLNTTNDPKRIIRFLRKKGFIRVRFQRPLLFWCWVKGIDLKMDVGDPTFVNLKQILTTSTKKLFIYQKG